MLSGIDTKTKDIILIVLMSGFFFLGLGKVHLFDWDEINFAESAREMLATGNYLSVQINFIPFWEKPPLFFWMQALSMKIFGVNEFAARFPNALFGLIYLLTLYFMGRKLTNSRTFAWFWVLLYFGSFLPHIYFKSGIIDPVFNYFIFVSVYLVFQLFRSGGEQIKYAWWAGIFSGLSFLTKGPVGLLLLLLTTGLASAFLLRSSRKKEGGESWSDGIKALQNHFLSKQLWRSSAIFSLGFLMLVFIWLGAEIYYHGLEILTRFVNYQIELFTQPVAGHGQPFYYHFVVVLIGCFPLSLFAIPLLWPGKYKIENDFRPWMVALFWVVMIIFSISTTKIIHYSSMTYLPLSFLAAWFLHDKVDNGITLSKPLLALYILLGSLWSILLIVFLWLINHTEVLIPMVKDKVAKVALAMPNHWTGWEPILGILFLSGFIASLVFFRRKQWMSGVASMSVSLSITLSGISYFVLPGIERFSQGSAIQFYQSLEHDDVYVETIGFKSYAQYFYKKIKDDKHPGSRDKKWLLEGPIDKDVYLVTKITNKELENKPGIQKLKCEGGFCFYLRKAGNTTSK